MTRLHDAALACVGQDPELWFSRERQDVDRAKAICRSCPAQGACLEAALAFEQNTTVEHRHGIWGGLGPLGRRKIARSRRALQRLAGAA